MLSLLAVSSILCLVSILGEGWAKKLPPECGIILSSPVFTWKYFSQFHSPIVKNERMECEIKASLRYFSAFYRYLTQKLCQKLQYPDFYHPAVSCGISVDDLFCLFMLLQSSSCRWKNWSGAIVIAIRNQSRRIMISIRGVWGRKYGDF